MTGPCEDDARHKQVEQALRASEEVLQNVFDAIQDGINVVDAELNVLRTNRGMERMYAHRMPLVGRKCYEVYQQSRTPSHWCPTLRSVETGRTNSATIPYPSEDDPSRWIEVTAFPVKDDRGSVTSVIEYVKDITEQKRVERDLQASEHNYRELVEYSNSIILRMDPLGKINYINEFAKTFLGYDDSEVLGENVVGTIVPEMESSGRDLREIIEDIRKNPETYWTNENENIRKDGRRVWIAWTNKPIRAEDGQVTEILCVGNDITERKRLEAQLQQSQKMETVGRLAGGVAHDFNNMLSVILGNVELAMTELDSCDPIRACLRDVQKAALRSADLTRQLLSFARRQTVSPSVLDLNQAVTGMLTTLERQVGEDIQLVWHPGKLLWPIKIDPSQINQVLSNLCVNARDAIDGVGKVTLETENVRLDAAFCAEYTDITPGEYVRLAVSDNGRGMSPETLSHVFEPFFTTKGMDEGTGLGMATVYGIVRQNGGLVHVQSEPSHGTTVTIHLRRHTSESTQERKEETAEPVSRDNPTILLVEDEPAILKVTKTMLERIGYHVLATGTPAEALMVFQENMGVIHLLMTDVIMSDMNGRELAQRILGLRPGLKCLFLSGHTADFIADHGLLDEGVQFLQKPFSLQALADKVREVLKYPVSPN